MRTRTETGARSPGVVGSNPVGPAVIQAVRRFDGAPYKVGGTTRAGIDCSGVVEMGYLLGAGIHLPHLASAQALACRRLSSGEVSEGDCVFYLKPGTRPPYVFHVALVVTATTYYEAAGSHLAGEVPSNLQPFPHWFGRPRAVDTGTTRFPLSAILSGAPLAICLFGGYPPTPSNIQGLAAWITGEKPHTPMGNVEHVQAWQWNNPLNTTDRWHARVNNVGPGISVYPDPITGAMAQARTIKGMDGMRGWPEVDAALQAGKLGAELRATNGSIIGGWGTNPSTVASLTNERFAVQSVPNGLGGSSALSPAQEAAIRAAENAQGKIAGSIAQGFTIPGLSGIEAVGAFFGKLPRYAEISGGATLMLGGGILLAAGMSGVGDDAAAVLSRGVLKGKGSGLSAETITQREAIRTQAVTERATATQGARATSAERIGASRSQVAADTEAARIKRAQKTEAAKRSTIRARERERRKSADISVQGALDSLFTKKPQGEVISFRKEKA